MKTLVLKIQELLRETQRVLQKANNFSLAIAALISFAYCQGALAQLTATTASNRSYKAGETFQIQLNAESPVIVSGTPLLEFLADGELRTAQYVSGSGTKYPKFHYVVSPTDNASSIIVPTSVRLQDGSLALSSGASLELVCTRLNGFATVRFDNTAPVVSSITAPSSGSYFSGQALRFILNFPEPVLVDGSPSLQVLIDSSPRSASYVSGSGTASLVFEYVIQQDDVSTLGVQLVDQIDLANGTIRDAAGNNTQQQLPVVDLSSVSIAGTSPQVINILAPAEGTYAQGQNLDFVFIYDRDVVVSGSPNVLGNIGGVLYPFRFLSSDGNQITFRFSILGGVNSSTGLRFNGAYQLGGGEIRSTTGVSSRSTYTPRTFSRHLVTTAAPSIVALHLPPSYPSLGYKLGDTVDFQVEFSEPVFISTGTVRIRLVAGTNFRYANYLSGSGTSMLTFRWVVGGSTQDTEGLTVSTPLNTNGDTVLTALGIAPNLTIPAAGRTPIKVDSFRPSILGVILPEARTYLTGEALVLQVQFSEPVYPQGNPRIMLTTDLGVTHLNYSSGAGSDTLIFSYVVQPSDNSPRGVSYASAISTDQGTVSDLVGNSFTGVLSTSTSTPAASTILLGDSPFITGITPPPSKTYFIGEEFEFTLNFSRPVLVEGVPRLPLSFSGVPRFADYVGGSGTTALRFRYRVVSGFAAPFGVRVLNSFTTDDMNRILPTTGGTLSLALTARTYTGVLIDAPAPSIVAINYLGPEVPELGFPVQSELLFEVIFTESLTADRNTSRLQLNLDGRKQFATMVSGSGTNRFVYRYRIPSDVIDMNGIEMVSPLDPSGAVIVNENGIAPTRTFVPPNLAHIKIMALMPHVIGFQTPAPGDYRTGEFLEFRVKYPRPVFVTGVPQLNVFVGPIMARISRWADFVVGSGTDELVYRYFIQPSDQAAQGITVYHKVYTHNVATIIDAAGNSAAVSGFGLMLPIVDLSAVTVNASSGISGITTPIAGVYKTGQVLDFVVNFGNSVNVVGAPALTLDIGGQSVQALYHSHVGSEVTFRYTVASGALDGDGIELVSPISLNGGSIQEQSGVNASLTFSPPDTSSIRIDGIDIAVASVSVPASATYTASQLLDFSVTFSHPVAVTGTPTLSLDIGGVARQASYQSGAGTGTLLFRYTVQASDSDFDGITLSSPVLGDIRDSFGDLATLSFSSPSTSAVLVSGTAPAISSVTPPANGKYGLGQNLNFIVNTTQAVNVTGTPRLTLTVGSTTRYATYVSGSGTSALTFSYQVQAGEFDSNGITMTGIVTLNGGTIRNPANVNMSPLTFTAPTMTSVLVDAIDLVLLSVSSPANGTYGVNGQLNFVAGFNYPTTVTGTPRIQLTIGATTRYATYVSGSGTTNLTFRYTIVAGEADANGIDSVGGAIQLNGGSISDPFGDAGTLTFSTGNLAGVLVDAVPPTVASMTVSAPKTYILNEQIVFTATYSEPVTVSGTPRLNLTIGSVVRYANYVSGSGTSTLTFAYVVGLNDVDTNGIASTTTVESNGGSISDLAGNAQTNFNYTRPSYTGVNVDGNIPVVSSITAPTSGTRGAGATIAYRLNFNQATTVVGSPRLQLRIGDQLREAVYASGSGTTAITFNYLTVLGDNDSDGVEVVSPLVIPSGASMKDVNGNDAQLSFTGVTHTGVLINTSNPNISNVVVPASNTYRNGLRATMDFTLQFNSNITVTGTPRLVLNVGGETVYAPYSAGTGTPNIRFRYSVLANHLDLDGVEFASNTIDLNGGVMRDAQMNNAELDFSIPDTSGLIVVLASMQSWYDASDSSKVVLNTDGNLTTLQDKIGTTHLTAIGTIPFEETGFNERNFGFITCTPTSYLNWNSNLATPRAVIAAFRAPASAGAEYLFQAGSRTLHFSSTANNGTTATGVNGAQFVGSDWTASTATQTNAWTPGQAQVRAYSWSSTQNTRHDYCKMNGELAEFFRFNAVPSAAEVQKIEEYLSNKYDLFLPQ